MPFSEPETALASTIGTGDEGISPVAKSHALELTMTFHEKFSITYNQFSQAEFAGGGKFFSRDQPAFLSRRALRADATAFTNSRAAAVILSRLPDRKAAGSTRSAPTPSAIAPAAMNSAAFAALTPPVGIS